MAALEDALGRGHHARALEIAQTMLSRLDAVPSDDPTGCTREIVTGWMAQALLGLERFDDALKTALPIWRDRCHAAHFQLRLMPFTFLTHRGLATVALPYCPQTSRLMAT